MSGAVVSVHELGITFDTPCGPVTALHDVSFSLAQGEILGIVGESGSGKSVARHALLRLLPKNVCTTSGDVRVAGRSVLELPERGLMELRGRRIAMIFQNPSTPLDPLMSVGRQIGEARRLHFGENPAVARRRAIDLLGSVRIPEPDRWVNAYPHELSGGMKQRVMIAAALACEPDVLVADEPTTALDVTMQAGILKLLKQLRDERGLSGIMVSHDLGAIADMCDRIVVMKDGRVEETGTRQSIIFAPQAAYTKKLIAAHPELGRDVAARPVTAEETSPLLELTNLTVHFGSSKGLMPFGRHPS